MTACYIEIDSFCCDRLSNLMDAGLVTPGKIDDRSIVDVRPDDLAGFERVHVFAGIGGWDHALNLAGWEGPVWTGSCPCQPFSTAGKAEGFSDPRHLWPAWFLLIQKCHPTVIFGEQVSSASLWLDSVYDDLEAEGFAVGAADLPAVAVDAKHKRHRLWFVAYAADHLRRSHTCGVDFGKGQIGCEAQGGAIQKGLWISGHDGFATSRKAVADPNRKSPLGTTIAQLERGSWCAEPAVGRVVDGVPYSLVGPYHRGFGNAIVPQVAAEFIRASALSLTS